MMFVVYISVFYCFLLSGADGVKFADTMEKATLEMGAVGLAQPLPKRRMPHKANLPEKEYDNNQ